jgi:hypothetical protein
MFELIQSELAIELKGQLLDLEPHIKRAEVKGKSGFRDESYPCLAAEALETKLYNKRVTADGIREAFPGAIDVSCSWRLDLRVGKPVYVDECTEEEALNMGWKRRFMKERGFRYIIVTPKMTNVLDVLNELDNCGN